jgi:hypothetical protein
MLCLNVDDRYLADLSAIIVAPVAQDRVVRHHRGGLVVSEPACLIVTE